MKTSISRALLIVGLLWAGLAFSGDLQPEDPWVREAPPGAQALAGYLSIANHGPAARKLVGADCPDFGRVELHRSVIENGMARMLPQEFMPIPAGGRLELKPGDYHLMLIAPKRALREGDVVEVTLRFDDGSTQTVSMPVKKGMGMGHEHMHHDHEHMHHH